MIIYFIILIFMTFIGAVASSFLKKASASDSILTMLRNLNLYIGGFLYVLSAVLNIWILRYLDYSVVLPLTSLTYIWTMVISARVLREKITRKKIIGVLLILLGAVCIVI